RNCSSCTCSPGRACCARGRASAGRSARAAASCRSGAGPEPGVGWSGVKIRPAGVAFWALVLFVASIPSEETVRLSGVGSLSRLLGMAALALGLLTLIRPRGRLGLRPPSLFLVIASGYLLWAVLSLFWALEPGVTRGRLITYTQLFVMAWLV